MSNTMTIPFLVLENPVFPLQLVQYLDPIDPEDLELSWIYQNHTCTFIADSLENHLSFSTMQTMLYFGLHGTFTWTNLNLHILMMLHIKYCSIAIANSLGENI
jgi:hypothetical protein